MVDINLIKGIVAFLDGDIPIVLSFEELRDRGADGNRLGVALHDVGIVAVL